MRYVKSAVYRGMFRTRKKQQRRCILLIHLVKNVESERKTKICGQHIRQLKIALNVWKTCNKQYLMTKARRKSSLIAFVVPFLILLPLFFDLSIPVMLSIFIGFFLVFIGIYPFLIELSNREEPIW